MNRYPSISTFQATKDLKNSQDQLVELQNRIHLLQQQDLRNIKLIQSNQKYLDILDEKRKRVLDYSEERKKRQQDTIQKNKKLQDRNRVLKQLRAQRMMNIRQDLYQNKKLQCQNTKHNSQHIQKKIKSIKKDHLVKNRQRRDLMIFQKQQRQQSIKIKLAQRSENIRNTTHSDISKMIKRKQKRQQQIQNLILIQNQLLQRCKTSNIMNLTLKEEISKKIGVQTPKKKIKILPSIHKQIINIQNELFQADKEQQIE